MDFSNSITHIDICNIRVALDVSKDVDVDTHFSQSVIVDYSITLDAKGWGLRGIDVDVKSVKCDIRWVVDCDELLDTEKTSLISAGGIELANNTIEGTILIDSTTDNWKVDNEVTFLPTGGYCINSVEVDFANKTITLIDE
jgi:hypothetical protein